MKIDIQDGEIQGIIFGNTMIPLKKRIKLSEANKLEGVLNFLEEYIDFSRIGVESVTKNKEEEFGWTDDELRSFLDETDSKKQKIFLKELTKNPERITWDQVRQSMVNEGEDIEPFSMAGILSCFARRAKHYGKKEDFWVSNWDNIKEERFYMLKKQYHKIFKEYFGAK